MFVRLKDKPFYFFTDRDTKYTYFIHNQQQQQRTLYYPQQFETMNASQIRSYKWKLVSQLMRWSLFNSQQMTVTDKKICYSKMIDFVFTFAAGLFMGSFMRRALFRIELPFFEMAFENSLFKPRWIKSMFAYSVATAITYNSLKVIMKEEYLVDLALEYRYNFNKSLTCREVDEVLNKLCQERFEGESGGQAVTAASK